MKIKSNDELKEIDYFDFIIRIINIDFSDFLVSEKSYKT